MRAETTRRWLALGPVMAVAALMLAAAPLALVAASQAPAAPAAEVTYTRHIAPILQTQLRELPPR